MRVLLDTGSQRTFIRQDLSKALKCTVLDTEELALVTFGRTRAHQILRCRRVEVTLRGQARGDRVTLEALEVPEICSVTSPQLDSASATILDERRYDIADAFQPLLRAKAERPSA